MQSTPDKVSNNQLYGAFIGGLASHTGNVLKADAARVPPKQVTREGYSTIGVIFLEPVMSSDRMDISKQTNAVNTQQSVQATATQDYSQPAATQQIQEQQQALQLNEAQQDDVISVEQVTASQHQQDFNQLQSAEEQIKALRIQGVRLINENTEKTTK